MQIDFYEDRLRSLLKNLEKVLCEEETEIEGFLYKPCGYKAGNELPGTDGFLPFGPHDRWGGEEEAHAWFYKKLEIPEGMRGRNVVLRLDMPADSWSIANPQFLAYVNGSPVQGLDRNHDEIFLDNAGASYEIHIYAYLGFRDDWWEFHQSSDLLEFHARLCVYDENLLPLYYALSVAYETALMLDPDERDSIDLKRRVEKAVSQLDLRVPRSEDCRQSVRAALETLSAPFPGSGAREGEFDAICIGHTHIDVAWLWTLAQTREKVLRSFSTVLTLMKRYPEYKFMSSQAQLYQFLKEEAPELFAEVKEMVKQGRWEVEGAMWVEADCNLSSGESLVRQILYGKSFFQREFGVDCKVLWLPDVFGYSAALPQILKKSGIEAFVTSKIGWNETNRLPYDSFMWEGIDGTEIFTYFLTAQDKIRGQKPQTATTYSALLNPSQLRGAYERYQQKELNGEVLVPFGLGDGGGGPTVRDLEYHRILKRGIPGVPRARMEFAGSMLTRLRERALHNPKTPHWQGELYLEYHRGTYTSMAQNKRFNRKSEQLFQRAETAAVMNAVLTSGNYPEQTLHHGWETILLNQFHDIIPGSSIGKVYEVSKTQYEKILRSGKDILHSAEEEIARGIGTDGGTLVFNPHSFPASGPVRVDGQTVYAVDIPAKGYRVLRNLPIRYSVKAENGLVENDFFRIELDPSGAFTRLLDKRRNREVLKEGARGNVMTAYEDYPRAFDNWEISNYHREKGWELAQQASFRTISDGARAGIEVSKSFLNSTVVQKIWLYDDVARIDFETEIDWRESHLVLKTAFPVDINADKATYEIQFGTVERPTHFNTSWDAARFEVCAHKFADLSEYGYGVSLLNDCKYGHDIHNGVICLTLLKCGTYPNPDADKCLHRFTYSLYPHEGDYREAGTLQQALLLNQPMSAYRLDKQAGTLPESYSLLSLDRGNIVIDTIKQAESSEAIIIRLYEAYNQRVQATLTAGFDFKRVSICDLLERETAELQTEGRRIPLTVKPFEIITLKIER